MAFFTIFALFPAGFFNKIPGAFAHFLKSMGRFPTEEFFRLFGICPKSRKIAFSSGADFIRKFQIVCFIKSVYKFQNGNSVSGSEVVSVNTLVSKKLGNGTPSYTYAARSETWIKSLWQVPSGVS